MRIIELFGGIGACTQALKRLGADLEVVDYVEIDKNAVASYNAINGTSFELQDITKLDKHFEDIDLIMHGSPCQDFSLAGKQAGGDEGSGTRSSLMYETIRIVNNIKPKYVIWENVKNLLSEKHKHNFDDYLAAMEKLGYKSFYQVLNAKDYGIPQNRERIFTVSIRKDIKKIFEFPKPIKLEYKLRDFLEKEVEAKYYIKKALNIKKTKNYIQWSNSGKMQNSQAERAYYVDNECMCTIPNCNLNGDKTQIVENYKEFTNFFVIPRSSDGKLINGSYNRIWKDDSYCGAINTTKIHDIAIENDNIMRIRKLTPKECWRLMGFSEYCFEEASKVSNNSNLYKQAGNSIVVNVLYYIFKNLLIDKKED